LLAGSASARFLDHAAGIVFDLQVGDTSERCILILWGTGANGKTTFVEVLRRVWGTYAKSADFHTFVTKKWGVQGGTNSDIAKLRGARFVRAAEGEAGQKLAKSLIKQLTGGDTVSACFKFKEPFDFISDALSSSKLMLRAVSIANFQFAEALKQCPANSLLPANVVMTKHPSLGLMVVEHCLQSFSGSAVCTF
jgi:hypothetical protein